MIAPSLETLFLPLETGTVAYEAPALFMGAAWHPFLKKHSGIDCWQTFKPLSDGLTLQSYVTTPDLQSEKAYALVLIHLPKQVEEAKYWIACALKRLKAGGILIAAAANDAGGGRIQKWFVEAGLEPLSESKNKSRVVWATRPKNVSEIVEIWLEDGVPSLAEFEDGTILATQPGIFSWNRIDPASQLLTAALPADLKGHGADFGCGNGFLSLYALKNFPALQSWTMIDADARAVLCAEETVKDVQAPVSRTILWHDLTTPVASLPPLDVILMNPPFHVGKKTDIELGRAFIRTAARHLKKSGVLYMVANAPLPYEAILSENFARMESLIVKGGFKVLKAVK